MHFQLCRWAWRILYMDKTGIIISLLYFMISLFCF